MKTLRFLTLCVCLLVMSMGRAEDIDPAHWFRHMPDTMRIGQLSIPLAHDAGTHKSHSCWYEDQKLDERQCFDKGVRGFDIRLHGSLLDNGYEFRLAHDGSFYNDFVTEVDNHFPTNEQLGDTLTGEFMIIDIGWEGEKDKDKVEVDYSGYHGTTSAEKWRYQQWYIRKVFCEKVLRKLISKYGKDRFIFFRNDLTVAEMRGRIILLVPRQVAPRDYCGYYYSDEYWVPMNGDDTRPQLDENGNVMKDENGDVIYNNIALCPLSNVEKGSGLGDSYIMAYNENSVAERDEPNSVISIPQYWSQKYIEKNRSSSTMGDYFTWSVKYYHEHIDDLNTQNIILRGHLNGYQTWCGGIGTASDSRAFFGAMKWGYGANHIAYDYIKGLHKPLGIVGMDFCGTDDWYWPILNTLKGLILLPYYNPCGETLTNEIVRHNYIQKQLLAEEAMGYVADVALYITKEKGNEQSQDAKAAAFFKRNGFTLVTDGSSDLLRDLNSDEKHRIYIGERRTMDPDSALTNFVLCDVTPERLSAWKARINSEGDTIGYLGHKNFSKVTTFMEEDVDWNGKVWDGDLRLDLGGNYLYLLKERHPQHAEHGLVKRIKMGWNKIAKGNLIPSYHVLNDPFGAPCDPLPLPGDNYLSFTAHPHHIVTDTLYNDSVHYRACSLCGVKFDMAPHTFNYTKGYKGYEHIASCQCGYLVTEACAAKTTFDETGFGDCTVCKTETYQPAVLNDSVYEIANAGQLYWFSLKTTYDAPDANAVLKNDIDFNPGMKVVGDTITTISESVKLREWSPIASCNKDYINELNRVQDSLNVNMSAITAGYKGTFDGQGHIVRGLKLTDKFVNGTDSAYYHHGLFGFVHGGTVKNVGVENSYFSAGANLGSIAGEARYATIENVYCNSSVINMTQVGPYAGGLLGSYDYTTLKNGYFDGVLSDYADTPIGPGYAGNTISNIYVRKGKYISAYLKGAIEVPDSFFTSGRLCYLLNDSTYNEQAMWRQNIDASDIQPGVYERDTVPVLNRHHSMMVPAVYNGGDFINLHFSKGEDGTYQYYRDGFDVNDKHDFACPVDFYVMSASQTRDVSNYDAGTLCLPFEVNNDDNSDADLYMLSAVTESGSKTTVEMKAVIALPSGIPGLYRKTTSGSNVTFRCTEGCRVSASNPHDVFSVNLNRNLRLVGTYTNDTISENEWKLYAMDIKKNEFVRVEDGQRLHSLPYRGWIEAYDIQQRTLCIMFTTAIESVSDDAEVDGNVDIKCYDLSGRAVEAPFKGEIVVQKGKKTLILKPTNSHLK